MHTASSSAGSDTSGMKRPTIPRLMAVKSPRVSRGARHALSSATASPGGVNGCGSGSAPPGWKPSPKPAATAESCPTVSCGGRPSCRSTWKSGG